MIIKYDENLTEEVCKGIYNSCGCGCAVCGEKFGFSNAGWELIVPELMGGTVVGTAISTGLEKSRKIILDMSVVLAVVALMGMFVFGTSTFTTAIFGNYTFSGVYNFSYVLFFGAVINLISGYVVPQFMLRSLQSFSKKPSMFGGAK